MNQYNPEIGQAVFGNPTGEFRCPEYITALLRALGDEIERVEWNRTQKQYEAPCSNNGGFYETDTFTMRSYYWGNCTCEMEGTETGCLPTCKTMLPNFKTGDIEIRWYKYLGRGMSINRAELPCKEFIEAWNRCMASVDKKEPHPDGE